MNPALGAQASTEDPNRLLLLFNLSFSCVVHEIPEPVELSPQYVAIQGENCRYGPGLSIVQGGPKLVDMVWRRRINPTPCG